MKDFIMCDNCMHLNTCKSDLKGKDKDCSSYDPIPDEDTIAEMEQSQAEEARKRMSRKWTTFKGKRVSLATIDHQHLSNCYWFNRILFNTPVGDFHLLTILSELAERFNGQLLPYRPHIQFTWEIENLREGGYVHVNYTGVELTEKNHVEEIWFMGQRVGEIINPL